MKKCPSEPPLNRSQNKQERGPGFLRLIEQSALPFVTLREFNKVDLETRSQLHHQIAERI